MRIDRDRQPFLAALLLIAVLFSATAFAAADRQNTRTVTLDVQNMTCFLCPYTIEKALNKVPGVIESDADYDSKTATVVFDPARTDLDALIQATTNAGYPSSLRQ